MKIEIGGNLRYVLIMMMLFIIIINSQCSAQGVGVKWTHCAAVPFHIPDSLIGLDTTPELVCIERGHVFVGGFTYSTCPIMKVIDKECYTIHITSTPGGKDFCGRCHQSFEYRGTVKRDTVWRCTDEGNHVCDWVDAPGDCGPTRMTLDFIPCRQCRMCGKMKPSK